MKFARESWSVGYGIDRALVSALFVRDTLALSADTDPHIPGVEPSLPVAVPAGVDRRAVALEWPGWWEDAVEAFTQNLAAVELEHTEALLTRPACRAAVLALKPAIERLCEAKRSSALPIGDVMRGGGGQDRQAYAAGRAAHRRTAGRRPAVGTDRAGARAGLDEVPERPGTHGARVARGAREPGLSGVGTTPPRLRGLTVV